MSSAGQIYLSGNFSHPCCAAQILTCGSSKHFRPTTKRRTSTGFKFIRDLLFYDEDGRKLSYSINHYPALARQRAQGILRAISVRLQNPCKLRTIISPFQPCTECGLMYETAQPRGSPMAKSNAGSQVYYMLKFLHVISLPLFTLTVSVHSSPQPQLVQETSLLML